MQQFTRYIALLRGIYIAGETQKRERFIGLFTRLGYHRVDVALSGGNILFMTPETPLEELRKTIEEAFQNEFGVHVDVIVIKNDLLQQLHDEEPFLKFAQSPKDRFFVTFLTEEKRPDFSLPHEFPSKGFTILFSRDNLLFSMLTLPDKKASADAVNEIEKHYGLKQTTRNWNSLMKILR